MTFRNEAKAAGLEPDECYCVGGLTNAPDLAIDVVYSSGGVDKLEIYRRLGVGEVWFVIEHRIACYRLSGGRFRRSRSSGVVKGLDLGRMSRILANPRGLSQAKLVRAFRAALR